MEGWLALTHPPITALPSLPADQFEDVRRRTIFECCKWDAQSEDVSILAPFPFVISKHECDTLFKFAESLAQESEAAERELLYRPDLHKILGLPRALRRAIQKGRQDSNTVHPRVIRFDFHATTEGWRISEANSDVPGGFIEGSGFTFIMSAFFNTCFVPPCPAAAYADAISNAARSQTIALVHATAYTDDRQVMQFLERFLKARGLSCIFASPKHVTWRKSEAFVRVGSTETMVGAVIRFFPADWLPSVASGTELSHWMFGTTSPVSNPAIALLTQSKRFPLVWDELDCDLSTWRALLPETKHPSDLIAVGSRDWVLKPVWGRVGGDVAVAGGTSEPEFKRIVKLAKTRPSAWALQRRFEALPVETDTGTVYPCLGIYTVNGKAAGIYARAARKPLVDEYAQDVAVLIRRNQNEVTQ